MPSFRCIRVQQALVALLCVAATGYAETEGQLTISRQKPTLVVVGKDPDPIARLAANLIAAYVDDVTGVTPGSGRDIEAARRAHCASAIILATQPIARFRPDGFRIQTGEVDGLPAVTILAPAASGLRYGSHRLIREFRQNKDELWLPALSVEANPWVKTRELVSSAALWTLAEKERREALTELHQESPLINWSIPRLAQYVDLIDALGFNGIQASLELPAQQRRALLQQARANGMTTACFVHGQADAKGQFPNPREGSNMASIKANWARLIEDYGDLADRWVIHWTDPGGCQAQDCTVNTPQLMTNAFSEMLREKGSRAEVFFSLWGLRWHDVAPKDYGWPGYDDWRSVVEGGALSPDIGICLMRHYDPRIARSIAAQDRKVGIWGWYLADFEWSGGLHVHTHLLQNEFRRIHGSASALLDWYSVDDQNHILNLPSLYVAAQLMWDSELDADAILSEFCDAVWGPDTAPAIRDALQAIADVRCGPGEVLNEDLWPDDYMCWLGKGSDCPGKDLATCEKAVTGLEHVQIDPGFVPKLPLVVKPEELLNHIRLHLAYVRDYARIRVAYEEALRPALEAQDFEETQRRMAALPSLPDHVPGTLGLPEYYPYTLLRDRADSWKGRTFSDNLALGKKATASRRFNGDPRFAPGQAVNGILCELDERGWAGGCYGADWIKIDLGAPVDIHAVRVYNRGFRNPEILDRREWSFDKRLVPTPTKADVFYALEDKDPSRGTADAHEPGYSLLGVYEGWVSDDPGAYQEVSTKTGAKARFIKVVVYESANGEPHGSGEIEVR